MDLALDPLQADERVELGQQVVEALGGVAGAGAAGRRRHRLAGRHRRGPARPRARHRVPSDPAATTSARGGPHDGQLRGRGDGGVADDAHGRFAEVAGGRGDLGQGLGVRLRVRGPLGREGARVAVGASRQRRPRLAASKKSWVLAPPTAAAQSAAAPGADSATAAASARASARATPASAPAVEARAATASTASAQSATCAAGSTEGGDGLMSVPPGRRLKATEPTGILGEAPVLRPRGLRRPRSRASGAEGPTRRRAPRRWRPTRTSPTGSVPWATRASASARHTASKTLSIVAASRSSWSMRIMSEDLPRSTGRLSANCRGSLR